jgi:hypothetical protein
MKKLIKPFSSLTKFILANFIVGFMITILSPRNFFDNTIEMVLLGSLWSGSISITQWLGHAYIGIKLDEKYDIIKDTKKRFLFGNLFLVAYSTFAFAIVQTILIYISGGDGIEWVKYWFPKFWHMPVIISFVISFVLSTFTYFKNWKESVLKEQKLKEEVLSYKYESLKNQLNPHFLFNSFNVLSDLIHEDQNLADKFVQKLSELYRYVLESRNKELISLKEELQFIESYTFLLKMRFENKLQINVDVNSIENKFLIPMSIQLLIENAVKHNEVSKENPLIIDIYQENNTLIVSNKIVKIKTKVESSFIGLSNLKQQYSFLTEKKIGITETNSLFMVKIPTLNN